MARRKATPDTSKLARSQPIAFARRQRTGEAGGADDDDPDDKKQPATKAASVPDDIPTQPITPLATAKAEAEAAAKSASVEAKPQSDEPDEPADRKTMPVIVPPERKAAEPWPDATPEPMRPVEPPRSRNETLLAPQVPQDFGRPPDMPKTSAPPPLALGSVEDPTHMPGPRELPSGDPDDPAPPPGRVPPGDSRSLRSGNRFALIYRVGTYVISRFGTVGTRGQWRVVEYPTSSSASHSYAKECSRFVSEGYSDYRD